MSTTTVAPVDLPISADLPATTWSAKLAAYTSRRVPADDPRVIACRAALAFHRVRRVIDAERDQLDPADSIALQRLLIGPGGGAAMA